MEWHPAPGTVTRRSFVQAAGLAVILGSVPGCRGRGRPSAGRSELRILQASHPVAAFDEWVDDEFARQWGEEHGVRVVVDHVGVADLLNRFLIPELFATVARGRATPEEAVARAGVTIEAIFQNWRARKRI